MKLWYQSMSRQKAWSDYNKALRRVLDAAGAITATSQGERTAWADIRSRIMSQTYSLRAHP